MNEIIKVKILWNSNNFYHDILLSIDMIPLIKAVETENVEIVRLLLKYPSIDVNAKAVFIFFFSSNNFDSTFLITFKKNSFHKILLKIFELYFKPNIK